MLKLRAVIKAIKAILRVGDHNKERTQSLLTVQITDRVLCGDPWQKLARAASGKSQCSIAQMHHACPGGGCLELWVGRVKAQMYQKIWGSQKVGVPVPKPHDLGTKC